jgi:cell division septation protein DedD
MTDDKDTRLSGLYRQSSREEPPARLDRAVMDLASKAVRRRSLAPFGNHWVAAGALAGICIVSVLLVVLLPEQAGVLDLPQSLQDADAPATELPAERRQLKSAADEVAGGLEESDAARPEAARERFDFYSILPEVKHEVPTEERVVTPATMSQPRIRAGQAASYVLQIDGFSSLKDASAMVDKLEFMRLDATILQGDDTQTGYRIRVGPYTDLSELERVQALLEKRGIKSTRERVP